MLDKTDCAKYGESNDDEDEDDYGFYGDEEEDEKEEEEEKKPYSKYHHDMLKMTYFIAPRGNNHSEKLELQEYESRHGIAPKKEDAEALGDQLKKTLKI